MKKGIFIFLTILSANSFSQKGFFIRPSVEHKWHINPGHSFSFTTPQGYTLNVNPVNIYTLKGFDLGMYAGYRNRNFFFETGVVQDQSNAGARISGTVFYQDSTYFHQEITEEMGIAYTKIPFRIGVKLFGKDSVVPKKNLRWQGFLYGGIDLLFRPAGAVYEGNGADFIINPNGDKVRYDMLVKSELSRGYSGTLGFMLKAYNKKGHSVMNLSVCYSYGRHQLSYNDMRFTNYDGTVYTAFVESKGSGLYLSIGKDIYPSNLIKKKKPKSFLGNP